MTNKTDEDLLLSKLSFSFTQLLTLTFIEDLIGLVQFEQPPVNCLHKNNNAKQYYILGAIKYTVYWEILATVLIWQFSDLAIWRLAYLVIWKSIAKLISHQ